MPSSNFKYVIATVLVVGFVGVAGAIGFNSSGTLTGAVGDAATFTCPTGYVCLRATDAQGFSRAYWAAVRMNSASSTSGTGSSSNTSTVFALNSQRNPEVWAKGTHHVVSWTIPPNMTGKVVAYLLPANQDGTITSGVDKTVIIPSIDISKGWAPIKLKGLENSDVGYYRVQAELMSGSRVIASVFSSSTVQVTPHGPPLITITSPTSTTQWKQGSSQRVTWTANFVKGKSKGDTTYPDIRVVPVYGIDPNQNDLTMRKLSAQDRGIIASLSQDDLLGLSKLEPDELAELSPDNVMGLSGISETGRRALSNMSIPGFQVLQEIDVLGIGDFTTGLVLKPLEFFLQNDPIAQVDPVAKAIFGTIFGDDKPKAVKATLYLVPESGEPIKLKNTYVEKAKSLISLNKATPGTYKIRLEAKLKNTTITADSASFTVIAK